MTAARIPAPLFQAPIPLRPAETADPLDRVEGKVDRLAERVDQVDDRIAATSETFGEALARLEHACRVLLDDLDAVKARLSAREDAEVTR